jgi:hypothetical protein
MLRFTLFLSVLLAIALPAIARAQSDAERTFRSRHGHDCCLNYSEYSEFCRLQGGVPSPNPPSCNTSGSSGGPTAGGGLTLKGSPARATLVSLFLGPPVGAAFGSLSTDVNGNNQWKAGAEAGVGLFLLGALHSNSGEWSRPTNAFVTMASGAFIGAAAGTATDDAVKVGSPQDATSTSKVLPYAGIGAGLGLATGLAFPGRRLSLFPGRRLQLLQRGNIFGMRFLW